MGTSRKTAAFIPGANAELPVHAGSGTHVLPGGIIEDRIDNTHVESASVIEDVHGLAFTSKTALQQSQADDEKREVHRSLSPSTSGAAPEQVRTQRPQNAGRGRPQNAGRELPQEAGRTYAEQSVQIT